MSKGRSLIVKGTSITVVERNEQDFISLTDMVKGLEGGLALIEQWLKNKDTVIFLGLWEKLNNPNFNSLEFEGIRNEAGRNSFYLSAKKWVSATNAIGLEARAGRYGGTYAQKDIAFEFGSWISPEFKLYLIREFQRLKATEASLHSLEWDFQRTLSKVNYRIHTDAIKEHLVPSELTKEAITCVYSNETDRLNMALFGCTAADWRSQYPELAGNIRDHATLEQLIVLSNLESINALLIQQNLSEEARLKQLNVVAITQMRSLLTNRSILRTIKTIGTNKPNSTNISKKKA